MSKKSCPFLLFYLIYKNGQVFLDLLYLATAVFNVIKSCQKNWHFRLHLPYLYCMSKKACPLLLSNLLNKNGQDFFDLLYLATAVFIVIMPRNKKISFLSFTVCPKSLVCICYATCYIKGFINLVHVVLFFHNFSFSLRHTFSLCLSFLAFVSLSQCTFTVCPKSLAHLI